MRATILPEPPLEFGGGARHIDPRFGIADYGPADDGTAKAPSRITVGLVGTLRGIEGAQRWLEQCREPIQAKSPNRFPRLFRDFPGFNTETTFRSELQFDGQLTGVVPQRRIARALTKPGPLAVAECVDLYAQAIERLSETNRCQVIICARPDDLHDEVRGGRAEDKGSDDISVRVDQRRTDFRDLLKARTLMLHTPIQLMRSTTWEGVARRRERRGGSRQTRRQNENQLQDAATRAWNLHTALYYKAGGVPWRMTRETTDLATLFVGVTFFYTPDRESVHTSVAQVFNERGDGVVVRGGPAARRKEDRQPHLTEVDAKELLLAALDAYLREHGNQPARIVLHKTSSFDDDELRGFESACDARYISHVDFIWLHNTEDVRAFRKGDNAVLRGTLLETDRDRLVLFTRGSIEFYAVYPGMYVPAPIGLRLALVEQDPEALATEVLALSKMNWNQSQLDGRLPITIRAARRVAEILKHVPDSQAPATRYANYI